MRSAAFGAVCGCSLLRRVRSSVSLYRGARRPPAGSARRFRTSDCLSYTYAAERAPAEVDRRVTDRSDIAHPCSADSSPRQLERFYSTSDRLLAADRRRHYPGNYLPLGREPDPQRTTGASMRRCSLLVEAVLSQEGSSERSGVDSPADRYVPEIGGTPRLFGGDRT
jgi:hypothetical protein